MHHGSIAATGQWEVTGHPIRNHREQKDWLRRRGLE
jgi:hypothetical protein